MWEYVAISAGVTGAGLWLLRRWGAALGLVDRPDLARKAHATAKPVVGLALATGTLSGLWASDALAHALWITLGGVGALLVGLDDDVRPRPAIWRLLAQLALAVGVMGGTGLRFDALDVWGAPLALGWVAWPLTALWVTTLTNAFNLIDGCDGVAVGVGGLIALGLAMFAPGEAAVWGGALAGGAAVVWWFNRPPARVFLGDGGAYFLGFTLAWLGLWQATGPVEGQATLTWALAALFVVPLGDVCYAVARRLWQRRSPLAPDTDHVHHMLERRWGAWGMLGALYTATAFGVVFWAWWR